MYYKVTVRVRVKLIQRGIHTVDTAVGAIDKYLYSINGIPGKMGYIG